MAEMFDISKEKIESNEPFPEILEQFMKNNSGMYQESLYLCESVDMDGNVIDTKIGVNLLTNYGLSDHFVSGNSRQDYMKIWLGSGQSTPDPSSSTLQTYISNLGEGSGYTKYYSTYPRTYDSQTQMFSCRMKVTRNYWDYTAGGNSEYEIWEIGVGATQTQLRTHALIYDEHGTQTCIVKRPNTRLYVTVFWTGSVSIVDIPQMYNNGEYILIDPIISLPWWGSNYMNWSMLTRGIMYTKDGNYASNYNEMSSWSWSTSSATNVVSGDSREVHYESGPSSINEKLWQSDYFYMSGFLVDLGSSWDSAHQNDIHKISYVGVQFQELQDIGEEIETYWCYNNKSFTQTHTNGTYTGTELDSWDMLRIDNMFGLSHSKYMDGNTPSNWDYPTGILPCTNFNITELNFYNHISKDWDIQVPHLNFPDTVYDDSWTRVYLSLSVIYNGSSKTVYVFVNRFPHDSNGKPIPKILSFANTNMVIAATDEYWDVSTYEEILNINSVPLNLQQKRYYVIVSGTVNKLNPKMDRSDWNYHQLNPTTMPYELTENTSGVIPRIKNHTAYCSWYISEMSYFDVYTVGSKPLVCNSKGYFCVSYLLAFVDSNDNWTSYELLFDDKYCGDRYRRWMTRTGDRIVMFSAQNCTDITSNNMNSVNLGFAAAANNFGVWTITDANTTPTREERTLVWSDATVVSNNTCYHLYSWSDLGYLVVAKRREESEFIWINVYDSTLEQHLVQNAKHARAIENTTYVFYQDMNLTMGTEYVFQVFDMATESIIETITIDDGTSYTVTGVYGYNDHLYIKLLSNGNIYTYYYNLQNGYLENINFNFTFMSSSQPYTHYATNIIDDMCILSQGDNRNVIIIEGNSSKNLMSNANTYTSCYNVWPCVNTINDDKQLIFTTTGRGFSNTSSTNNISTNLIFDLGLIVDGDTRYTEHYPYMFYKSQDTQNAYSVNGPIFPFKNGIIRVIGDRYNYNNLSGRIVWFPPEMCLPMHMKGTTKTLNSYNAPVNWSITKKLKWNFTNDLSRLLPNNGG